MRENKNIPWGDNHAPRLQVEDFIDFYTDKEFTFFWTGSKEKKVVTPWRDYVTIPPTLEAIEEWRKKPIQNWAILTGQPSGIVVVDVDTIKGGDPEPFFSASKRAQEETGQPFYTVRTQSGGYHFYFKYTPLLAKTKHKRHTKIGDFLHAIDIQSDGAIVFAPPSEFVWQDGTLHNYEYLEGSIQELPSDLLQMVLEELAPKDMYTHPTYEPRVLNAKNMRPGDWFNITQNWETLLIGMEWEKAGQHGETSFWRRPLKKDGVSATLNYKGYDMFYPFTTTSQLEPNKGYTKFSLWTHWYFDGDFRASAWEAKNFIITGKSDFI